MEGVIWRAKSLRRQLNIRNTPTGAPSSAYPSITLDLSHHEMSELFVCYCKEFKLTNSTPAGYVSLFCIGRSVSDPPLQSPKRAEASSGPTRASLLANYDSYSALLVFLVFSGNGTG